MGRGARRIAGAVATFSFYPTKNLSAYGDAGMVTTRDPENGEAHAQPAQSRQYPPLPSRRTRWNTRMDAIQAAVLRVKLTHI